MPRIIQRRQYRLVANAIGNADRRKALRGLLQMTYSHAKPKVDGHSVKRRICPCCGQDEIIPNEFTRLNVKASQRLLLFKLYRAMPNVVCFDMLMANRDALRVNICRLREALSDIGSEYVVQTVYTRGYAMRRIAR